jgi:hypothetical protein
MPVMPPVILGRPHTILVQREPRKGGLRQLMLVLDNQTRMKLDVRVNFTCPLVPDERFSHGMTLDLDSHVRGNAKCDPVLRVILALSDEGAGT